MDGTNLKTKVSEATHTSSPLTNAENNDCSF